MAAGGEDDGGCDYGAEEGSAAYFVKPGDAEGAALTCGLFQGKTADWGLGHVASI